jgi:O-antigen biosynthesis protein
MTNLSIVIVNYNVRHFIIKCLESIYKSKKNNFDIEVIVVDNASVDGSNTVIKDLYPQVILIENSENVGFAKANNQGFRIAKGQYILALNPDTIIQEDTLTISLEYMMQNPNCGVCGVKMIDGSGAYLPESKRGLPTLWNSFCKFSGLTNFFPNSKIFSGYYMGHLSEDNVHDVEVLCGAFMLFKSKPLMHIGGFDEDYFMYGEDIDLSLRFKNEGYRVVYLPTTRIIHFKGESSKKASFNYIKNFYNAMLIYVRKNYNGWNGIMMKFFIRMAIYFSALASYIKNNIIANTHLFIDGIILYGTIGIIRILWGKYYFDDATYFNNQASLINDVSFVFFTIGALWFFGHYDKNWKVKRLLTGIAVGTFMVLVVFALLPVNLRSSRALILIDSLIATIVIYIIKAFRLKFFHWLTKNKNKKYLVVANESNALRIADIIKQNDAEAQIVGTIAPKIVPQHENSFYINTLDKLGDVVKMMKAEYVVFSNDDMNLQQILDQMILPDKDVKYLITGGDKDTVIGSSKNSKSKNLFFAESSYKLSQSFYLRLKRMFDVVISVCFIVLAPILLLFISNKKSIYSNVFKVMLGNKSWVGYVDESSIFSLPNLKNGVFDVSSLIGDIEYYPLLQDINMANTFYAKMYGIGTDFKIIVNNIKNGNNRNY